MAALPPNRLIEMIDEAYSSREERPRFYLGASSIGHECERKLWLNFRFIGLEKFNGRMLRLFQRGHREEAYAVGNLRAAGCEVQETDPNTGRQFRFFSSGFGGSCDGIIVSGVPEAPNKPHVLEIKTHSKKSFDELVKDGVEKAKPQHFVQMQVYMAAFDVDRALYYAVCKDDDRLHIERVRHDKAVSDWAVERAQRVIFDHRLPPPLSKDPTWYQCKFCSAHEYCHGNGAAPSNCRTCVHGSMQVDGAWKCAHWGADVPEDAQLKGCEAHSILGDLVPF
jgi:hypothetical protein